jgi:hypothetical protein
MGALMTGLWWIIDRRTRLREAGTEGPKAIEGSSEREDSRE